MATEKLNVLLVGGGGREHALAWKLRQSSRCQELFATPDGMANPGIAALAKPVDIPWDLKDAFRIQRWCVKNRIGLAVIGPEEPLCAGLADILRGQESVGDDERGTRGGLGGTVPAVFGPSKAAARLEGDKAYCKEVLRQASVPTAEGRSFTDYEAARRFLDSRTEPHVIKACGLAKGKGVFVPSTQPEAVEALDRIMVKREFGDAGKTVLIEERLKGREVSVFALVDGRTIYVLESCQDHKRLRDGAQGPNTGGMGALCPTPVITDALLDRVQREVLVPTIDAMKRDGVEYTGVLYAGLMLTPGGPKVLEYNCRFGDPECQTLMMRLESDLVDVLEAVANGTLESVDLRWTPGAAACVVMAAEGYPERPVPGSVISGIEAAEQAGATVFHAGTRRNEKGQIVTSGGRVLCVAARGADSEAARAAAYAGVSKVSFPGMQWRRDIGTETVG